MPFRRSRAKPIPAVKSTSIGLVPITKTRRSQPSSSSWPRPAIASLSSCAAASSSRADRTQVAPLRLALADDSLLPGKAYLAETPVLHGHVGTQPDLFLRWNAIPLAAESIDIVVHLHGFSQQGGAMPLSEKVPKSGLDLSRRSRPTLALLPRGNWIRHYYYDFPALLSGGIDALIAYAAEQFARAMPSGGGLDIDRVVLSAHSGGVMPAIDVVAGAAQPPDELYLFDGPCGAAVPGARGAEVIRPGRSGGGGAGGLTRVGAGPGGGGALFLVRTRNKLGMPLDPPSPKGRKLVKRPAATTDVVVANLPPAV